ncbi:MAG: hypothetical protein IT378_05750 [Sandaracinaceae bacterium]|nr:hypothetical protein [Sandaracinaceae bacterium]
MPTAREWLWTCSAWALAGLIFIADRQVPPGFAGGILYVIPILLGLRGGTSSSAWLGVVSMGLAAIDPFLGDQHSSVPSSLVVANRVASVVSIAMATILVLKSRRSAAALERARVDLMGERAALEKELEHRQKAEAAREALVGELESKNAELERFTYTVSHDLKSPLITIKGFLGMLEKDARDGNLERLRSDIARISGASDRMRQLLDDLLELSRVGRVINAPEDLDMNELSRQAVDGLSAAIEARGVDVRIAPSLPRAHGDRVRLREVLQNLVENAVKFMGEQPAPVIVAVLHRRIRELLEISDRLAAGERPRPYAPAQHRAWLKRRSVQP